MLKNILFFIACLTLPQGIVAMFRLYNTDFWGGVGSLLFPGIFFAFGGFLEYVDRRGNPKPKEEPKKPRLQGRRKREDWRVTAHWVNPVEETEETTKPK